MKYFHGIYNAEFDREDRLDFVLEKEALTMFESKFN